MSDVKIAIIVGSTRPGRNGKAVADWVYDQASQRDDAGYERIDLLDYPLPQLEAMQPSPGQYANEHTRAWAAKVAGFDGYVFVTPEYNHSTSAALKNAIDHLYGEWNNKAAGFVSYGGLGEPGLWSICGSSALSCRSLPFVLRSRCRCSPTSRTSAISSRPISRCRPSATR